MHSGHEACRRKALFPPALKRLVESLHKDVVSFRQKTTERPTGKNGPQIRGSLSYPTMRPRCYRPRPGAIMPCRPRRVPSHPGGYDSDRWIGVVVAMFSGGASYCHRDGEH